MRQVGTSRPAPARRPQPPHLLSPHSGPSIRTTVTKGDEQGPGGGALTLARAKLRDKHGPHSCFTEGKLRHGTAEQLSTEGAQLVVSSTDGPQPGPDERQAHSPPISRPPSLPPIQPPLPGRNSPWTCTWKCTQEGGRRGRLGWVGSQGCVRAAHSPGAAPHPQEARVCLSQPLDSGTQKRRERVELVPAHGLELVTMGSFT